MRILTWLENVWRDVRYAVRGLRNSPGFAATTVVTLTITTGVTINFAAVVEGLLFKPWPVVEPGRMVVVDTQRRSRQTIFGGMYLSEYRYLRENARSVDLTAFVVDQARIGSLPDQPIRLVSGNYFRALRLPLVSGRGLLDSDDSDRATPVAVISRPLWIDQFGGQPAVGHVLTVNDRAFTIVGIAGAGATDSPYDALPTVWVSLSAQAVVSPRDAAEPNRSVGTVAGRLTPGSTRRMVQMELTALNARIPPVSDYDVLVTTSVKVTSTPMSGQVGAQWVSGSLGLISIVPGLVLLLGCANIGNLQLARGFSRRREIAVRLALGASRARVIRQLLIDGLLLCLCAGGLSLLIAYALPYLVLEWLYPYYAKTTVDLTPDLRLLAFAATLAFLTCLASGLLPALRATRISTGAQYIGVERARLRSILLAIQTGLSVVLVLGAGLLARGIQHASGAGLGFDAYKVAVVTIDLPKDSYDLARRRTFATNLLDAADASGLRPIAGATTVPYTTGPYVAEVRSSTGGVTFDHVVEHFVSPGYFDVLKIPLRAGRVFGRNVETHEAVINESLARILWRGQNPVGRSFTYTCRNCTGGKPDPWKERLVVGVVADARTEEPDQALPGFFEPAQSFRSVIASSDPASVAHLRNLVSSLEPRAVMTVGSMAPDLWKRLHSAVVMTSVAVWISLLALFIAAVGMFGVFSFVVGERTPEIGVRMALGARPREIGSLLTRRLCGPLGAGLVLGLAAAQPLGTVVQHQLFGVGLHDPLAYAIVVGALSLSAGAALIAPVRRALHVDPAATLRHE